MTRHGQLCVAGISSGICAVLGVMAPEGWLRERQFVTLLPGGCRVPGCHQAGWGTPLPPSFLEAVGCQAAEIGQGGGPQVFDEQCW